MAISASKLSEAVAKREGGKVNLSIAQVKECQRCVLIELGTYRPEEVLALIQRTVEKAEGSVAW